MKRSVKRFVQGVCALGRKVGTKLSVFLAALVVTAASASADTVDYSVVSKDATTGGITFTPEKFVTPLVDGMVSTYKTAAIIILIIVAMGIIYAIFAKKGK